MFQVYSIEDEKRKAFKKEEQEKLKALIQEAASHNHRPLALDELEEQAKSARQLSQQLHIQTLIGAHKKARGINKNDTFPYTQTLLNHARQVWKEELTERARAANLSTDKTAVHR